MGNTSSEYSSYSMDGYANNSYCSNQYAGCGAQDKYCPYELQKCKKRQAEMEEKTKIERKLEEEMQKRQKSCYGDSLKVTTGTYFHKKLNPIKEELDFEVEDDQCMSQQKNR